MASDAPITTTVFGGSSLNGGGDGTTTSSFSSSSSSFGGGGAVGAGQQMPLPIIHSMSLSWDKLSPQMKELLLRRNQIKSYMELTNNKVYDIETSYLEEPNSLGNLIRGWDVDGRTLSIRRG